MPANSQQSQHRRRVIKLLVLGATGYVGGILTRLALNHPAVIEVIAPTRRPLLLQHAKLKNPIVNFDALDPLEPWWTVDAAINTLGSTMAETPSRAAYENVETTYPVAVGALVRERGATAFAYVSSIGASPASHWFYLRTKGKTEGELGRLGFPSLTLLRPSGIIGIRQPRRPSEEIALNLMRLSKRLLPKRWRVVTGEQVARVLLDAVLWPRPGTHVVESETIQAL